jgi:hypothetical protein
MECLTKWCSSVWIDDILKYGKDFDELLENSKLKKKKETRRADKFNFKYIESTEFAASR